MPHETGAELAEKARNSWGRASLTGPEDVTSTRHGQFVLRATVMARSCGWRTRLFRNQRRRENRVAARSAWPF